MDNNNEKPRHRGRVACFLVDRHFGFLVPDDRGSRLFFHISAVTGDVEPAFGDRVTFAAGEDDQGRPRAYEIELVCRGDHERN
jgi:cold shock CspA family protein